MIEHSPDRGFSGESSAWSSYELSATETPTESIVYAVADVSGRDPLELCPLYEVVDPDAVDRLFGRSASRECSTGTKLRFVYEGHEICIDDRRLVLRGIDRDSSQALR
ncbi:HalOD1 output domain-containing protein [Natronoglomus mannanivorans]|uniref:Halobacterial output domain-containing protein n=1 Tax=Natronoglomus mannanivorans TaxID=2979990 RepID=A0AAP2Z2R7_9EURY|nr:hypothetical protein [Halobacteria archaeon AArc-xg1-1]